MKTHPWKSRRQVRFTGLFVLVAVIVSAAWLTTQVTTAEETTQPIIVELSGIEPGAVAADKARAANARFDRGQHHGRVMAAQAQFLSQLRREGIDFEVTHSAIGAADGVRLRPNQFSFLINAVGLEVAASDVDRIRSMHGVKEVTLDEPVRLALDNSVRYVRASDGPGNKEIFNTAGGPLSRYDGTGQVVAILDTGVEHTHPMFDTRFDDADFESRTGDARPVRTAGQPYLEGTHHPKVVYFLPLTGTTNEDDVGHGTHAAADAAGLKTKAPGPDRIPGTADDQIVEGVAPGALLMNYKICEAIFSCVGATNIVTALEDALSPTDIAGFPKPVATVINMSFGSTVGNPNSATSVASNNAALAGAVVVSSAGNSGANGENTAGAPAVARRVIGVAATNDPGAGSNEVDVLVPDALRYTVAGMSTGAQNDTSRAVAPQDLPIKAILMGGASDVPFNTGQHYVYVGFADTPGQVPDSVRGRIALASRGSTVDAGASGTGLFANKAAQAAAKGAIALLVFNNVEGELDAATTQASAIPTYGVSRANGLYLRDTLGFDNPLFDPNNSATWGASLSKFPVRINKPSPATYEPATTGFSSRGPADNYQYLKPDVTAPGANVYAATIPAGGLQVAIGVPPAVGGTMSDPSRYIAVSGTSFSGPHVAGAAALVRGALLDARGHAPILETVLRSGDGAGAQQAQNVIAPQSHVRAALTNTATNLRLGDNETALPAGERRNLIHEIGSGLIHVIGAVNAHAVMGTNDTNGAGGPDDAGAVDFLPTHSFGLNAVINTGVASQPKTITVTLENISGAAGAGTYALSFEEGGNGGDITRPILGTTGVSVSLSAGSVALGASVGSRATYDVTVNVDGRPAPTGLEIAGTDDTGATGTEFLWWVVARGDNGETLRMPFYYRATGEALPPATREAPFQNAIADDATPDQVAGVDRDGNYRLSWTFPGAPAEQPCAYRVEEATAFASIFNDDAEELLVAGDNSTWTSAGSTTGWVSTPHPDTGTNGYSPIYIDSQSQVLTLQSPISIPAGASASLSFDSFEDIEATFDFGFVEASGDGGPFVTLASYDGFFSGRRVVDLGGFAGQDVSIRFRFVSDLLVSTPVHLGWFIDNIEVEIADFTEIATVDSLTQALDITGRATGTYFYRIAGVFGDFCDEIGTYSNIRQIEVDIEDTPDPIAPTASFTANPNPAQVAQTVTFDASASTDNDDVGCNRATDARDCIVSYFWSFGDGTTRTTADPVTTHAYAAPGTYRVALTVRDDDNQTDATERFVQVDEAPKPAEKKVTGGGWITASGGKANFGFNAKRKGTGAPSGNVNYHDKEGGVKVSSDAITGLTITGNRATITAACSVNKVSGFTCTVDVVDNGEPGSADLFTIRISNGYEAGGTLGGGNIQIHN